jgi:glucose-1-phosphate thymidylyltransferase
MRIATMSDPGNRQSGARNSGPSRELVGLIPAAGLATRIAPLPGSKELFPVGYSAGTGIDSLRPKPVCLYLLEAMHSAGVRRAFIVLRTGKWDIPAYLGSGGLVDISLAYLIMQYPYGAPYTIDEAYPFIKQADILFGFPDILFQGEGVYQSLYLRLEETNADVVIGLFPTQPGQRADMVETGADGRVQNIIIKPEETDLLYAWISAVWRPSFSTFLHMFIQQQLKAKEPGRELYIGDVLQAAVDHGLSVQSVTFPDQFFYDIGTPEGLLEAVAIFGGPPDMP